MAWHRHKWTKWKQYQLNWNKVGQNPDFVSHVDLRQQRACIECDKTQDELVAIDALAGIVTEKGKSDAREALNAQKSQHP